jgi:hypothetical protein
VSDEKGRGAQFDQVYLDEYAYEPELIPCVEDQAGFRQDLAALSGDADQIARDFEALMQHWFGPIRFVTVSFTPRERINEAKHRARRSTWIKSHRPWAGYAGRHGHTCKTCRKG